MSRGRKKHKPRLVTGFYGQEDEQGTRYFPDKRHGLDWRGCDRCGRRCQPYRYALQLICGDCRWLAVYHRPAPPRPAPR